MRESGDTLSIGSIRAVNVRGEPEYRVSAAEVLVMADRSNPALGNPHRMLEKSRRERERVVSAYERDLDADLRRKAGPRYLAVRDLAERVAEGEQIGLGCWCVPVGPCHAEIIANRALAMARAIKAEASANTPRPARKP